MQIIHKIGSKAEKRVEEQLLEDFRRVRGKTGMLFRLAEVAVDHPYDSVKQPLYSVVGLQTLKDFVKEHEATGSAFRLIVHTVLLIFRIATTIAACWLTCLMHWSFAATTTRIVRQSTH